MVLHRLVRQDGPLSLKHLRTQDSESHRVVGEPVVQDQQSINVAVPRRPAAGLTSEDDEIQNAWNNESVEEIVPKLRFVSVRVPARAAER